MGKVITAANKGHLTDRGPPRTRESYAAVVAAAIVAIGLAV